MGLGTFVVHLCKAGAVAFHHVVAETDVAEVVEQEVEIGLDNLLHVLALVVKVTHAAPAFASVVVRTETEAIA